jgi:hypothetical protein
VGAGAAAGSLLGDQLLQVSFTRPAAIMISCLLTSSTRPSLLCRVCCKLECEGLGLQVCQLMMSTKYSSNPAKLRDLIREMKQKS